MITLKLAIAILAFILSSGQIVFQTFQHHHAVNPKHGAIKFVVFLLSSLSLLYLAKDIYSDFDTEKKPPATITATGSPAELDYWRGIDREASPEGYCDYLEKYPQGQFEAIARHRAGDCLEVKRQAAAEAQKKSQSEIQALKEKFDNEAKTLAEKNAALEQEAKENAARIVALEQAKAEAERLKVEMKSNPEPEFSPQTEQTPPKINSEITTQLENEEPLF
jgi:hypothetical protein